MHRSNDKSHGRLAALAVIAALGALSVVPAGASATAVYAASSLRDVFKRIDSNNVFSFLGSDTLEKQIEQGAPADVFAAASPFEPAALYRKHLCSRPQPFATNKLMLITPKANPGHVRSVYDLAGGGRRLAIGNPGVPIGIYTRRMLGRLHISAALRRNTVSQEATVAAVVSKVALGSADAGVVYITDARIAAARLHAITIPAKGQPAIRYDLCRVTRRGADTAGANRFIAKVLAPRGRRLLHDGGFGVPARK